MKEYIVSEDSYEYEMRRYDELKELIRCKDCKYYQTADFADGFTCYLAEGVAFAKEDDFCSLAERKEECGHQ